MYHGFDESKHLVVQWQWRPKPPTPWSEALPKVEYRHDDLFLATTVHESEMATFNFSFPQLAKQTPDLRFYRLIQIFNTPLLSLSTREAGQSGFAYWRGASPKFRDDFRWAHFWFFNDASDGDTLVVEYGFDGGLILHSEIKSPDELANRYGLIIQTLRS